MQRLQGERRVADPRVAVVPVALAAGRLGQRRRERRDRGAGRHVRQPLDRERGALDRLAKAMIRDARAIDPGAPEPRRRLEARGRLVDVGRGGELLGPRQRAERTLAFVELVARAHTAALDAQQQVGRQPDRLAGAGRVGVVAVVADQCPLRWDAAVVEHGLADEVDVDAAPDAFDGAHEQVLRVVVERRARMRGDRVVDEPGAHRQRVAHDDPAGRHVPGGDQHVGPGLVRAVRGRVGAERPEPEIAGLAVEQRAEHGRRVEARDAEPADTAVRRDERARVAVRDERVVGDRGKRRRRGGALRARARVGAEVIGGWSEQRSRASSSHPDDGGRYPA